MRFPLETGEHLKIFRDIIGEEFQGNKAMQAGVFGFIDHAHAAAAKPVHDVVVGKNLADERVGGGHFGQFRVGASGKSTNGKRSCISLSLRKGGV